jgi:F-type H+-transporting ATPase subunit c
MKKTVSFILLALSLVLLLAPVVFAEEAATAVAAPADAKLKYYGIAALACGIAIGIAAFGASIGQGMGLKGATEGIARNPGASGKITTTLIIGLAMIGHLPFMPLLLL